MGVGNLTRKLSQSLAKSGDRSPRSYLATSTRRLPFLVAAVVALIGVSAAAASRPNGSPWSGKFNTRRNSFTFEQAPDWLPGGRRIVHHADPGDGSDEQIYNSRLDGSGTLCLTCGLQGPNMVPVAQPGGRWVLFHSWHGHQLTVGAPGFGGMGSDLWVVKRNGRGNPVRLTTSEEGHDNFHAYWSPNGRWVAWTTLNWNFVTEDGNGKSKIVVARFRDNGPAGPRLTDIRTVRPPTGHWYETQSWAPDGSGFLYTESIGRSLNNDLWFCRLFGKRDRCERIRMTRRLSHTWEEQAVFTPDMERIIFMSTYKNPGAFNDYEQLAGALGLPTDADYALILPVFYFGFLQPVFEQANDLYQAKVRYGGSGQVRGTTEGFKRLTTSGRRGWVKPEFAFGHGVKNRNDDTQPRRLLFTQVRITDGLRLDQRSDLRDEIQGAVAFLQDPNTSSQFQVGVPTQKKTIIGRFSGPERHRLVPFWPPP